jgi:hypothetical protein
MSVVINAKGTSIPQFTIGKNGITIYQGFSNPYPSVTPKDGDYWLDKTDNSLWVWDSAELDWIAPRIAFTPDDSNNWVIVPTDIDQAINELAANTARKTLVTTTTAPDQVLDSVSASVYSTSKYIIQVKSGNNYQACEILLMNDGTDVYLTQYANINSGAVLATFDADITSGNIRLLVSPVNANTTVKSVRTSITI